MLKLIFMCFFMIPLMLNFWLMSNMMFLLIMIFIILFHKNFMYIGYMMQLDLFSYGLIILSIWISLLMIISSPKYKNINHEIFMFLVLMLMNFLILSFSSSSLIFFFWSKINSNTNNYYWLSMSTSTNKCKLLFDFLYINCFNSNIIINYF